MSGVELKSCSVNSCHVTACLRASILLAGDLLQSVAKHLSDFSHPRGPGTSCPHFYWFYYIAAFKFRNSSSDWVKEEGITYNIHLIFHQSCYHPTLYNLNKWLRHYVTQPYSGQYISCKVADLEHSLHDATRPAAGLLLVNFRPLSSRTSRYLGYPIKILCSHNPHACYMPDYLMVLMCIVFNV